MSEEKTVWPPDPLFHTRKRAILHIWDRMQRLQTDFSIAQELSFYYTSPHWLAARSVLDLGTGNGYYLAKIAASFPDKRYHGVDLSPELIATAHRETSIPNITFSHASLFDLTGSYDFVLMRLLIQHLDNVPAALDYVATLTGPTGSALVIDAHDPTRFFYPALPEFMDFFAAYTEHQGAAGRDRRVSNCIERALSVSSTWTFASTLQLLIPSTIAGNLDLLTRTYISLVDLVEQAGGFAYDFPSVRRALERWSQRPDAYMQVGLNLIHLVRN